MGAQFLFSVVDDFCDDVNKMRWFAKMGEEYIRVRPYFTGDFYPLTGALLDETAWCASQWDRPEQQDGLIQVFKRASSVYQEAVFKIYNICAKKKYLISDLDGGEYLISGEQLLEEGFKVRITEQKVAKIYLYKVIE